MDYLCRFILWVFMVIFFICVDGIIREIKDISYKYEIMEKKINDIDRFNQIKKNLHKCCEQRDSDIIAGKELGNELKKHHVIIGEKNL